jgi:hypothetical protein
MTHNTLLSVDAFIIKNNITTQSNYNNQHNELRLPHSNYITSRDDHLVHLDTARKFDFVLLFLIKQRVCFLMHLQETGMRPFQKPMRGQPLCTWWNCLR